MRHHNSGDLESLIEQEGKAGGATFYPPPAQPSYKLPGYFAGDFVAAGFADELVGVAFAIGIVITGVPW